MKRCENLRTSARNFTRGRKASDDISFGLRSIKKMKKQKKEVPAKKVLARDDEKKIAAPKKSNKGDFSPVFVEADKMFDRFFRLNREIGQRAFELFLQRDAEFGSAFDDWLRAEAEFLLPVPVEITENKKQFNIKARVHGFKPEDIEISVKDKLLILSGETEERKEAEDTGYSEWHHHRFFRALPLPGEIDFDKAKAKLKDDVLQLALPKLPEQKPKRIDVNAG